MCVIAKRPPFCAALGSSDVVESPRANATNSIDYRTRAQSTGSFLLQAGQIQHGAAAGELGVWERNVFLPVAESNRCLTKVQVPASIRTGCWNCSSHPFAYTSLFYE